MRWPTSAMPAPEKKGDKEGEESSVSTDSSYEEVEPKGSGIEKNQYFPMFKCQSFWVSISCFQGPFNIDMKY